MSALRRNLVYKILSLAISILLYFIASAQSGSRTPTELFVTPEVTGIPPDLVLRAPPAGETISLSGPPALIEAFRGQALKATVDARDARPGVNHLPVVYRIPSSFRGRLVVANHPETVALSFERPTRRTLSIDVLYDNAPPAGFRFGKPVAVPDQAAVTGLREEVEKVQRVVANLETAEATGAIDRSVTLVALDARRHVVENVKIAPSRVQVRLPLQKTPASKTVLLSLEPMGLPAPGYRLANYRFAPQAVTVTGEQDVLERLSSIAVPFSVAGRAASDVHRVPIPIPPGVRLAGPTTAEIALDIRPLPRLSNPSVPSPTRTPAAPVRTAPSPSPSPSAPPAIPPTGTLP